MQSNGPNSPSLGPNELSVYVTPAAIDFVEGQVPQPFLLYNPFTYPVRFRVQTSNRERYLVSNRSGHIQETSVATMCAWPR